MTDQKNSNNQRPVSTKMLVDATSAQDHAAIDSCFMVFCPTTSQKGSSFAISGEVVVTNEHVVRGEQVEKIVLIDADGRKMSVKSLEVDARRDLAFLLVEVPLESFLELSTDDILVGANVKTWGFPLGYHGPAPLLIQGTIAGLNKSQAGANHVVVNAAFNQGNSGGPLIDSVSNKVIGVVCSKHAPLTAFQSNALDVLVQQRSGMQYTARDEKGKTINFSEAQIVGDILNQLVSLTQVVIGEAITASELRDSKNSRGLV